MNSIYNKCNRGLLFIPNVLQKCVTKTKLRASLMAQWERVHLAMRETQAPSLIWEDRTCHGATKPTHHNYWACALGPRSCNYWAHVSQLLKAAHPGAHALQREKPPHWEACAWKLESSPWSPQLEKSSDSNEASHQVLFSLFNRPMSFHMWTFASYSLIF